MLDHSRRRFLTGLVSALAAPAIVRASSIMPVRAVRALIVPEILDGVDLTAEIPRSDLYAELVEITRRAFIPRLHISWNAIPWVAEMRAAQTPQQKP